MPIYVEILETETHINIPFIYNTRTTNLRPKLTLTFPGIYDILLNKKAIDSNVQKIESQIRFLKKSMSPTKSTSGITTRNKLLVDNPGKVFVSFNTRTRYF